MDNFNMTNDDVIDKIYDIAEKIEIEKEKEEVNESKVTKLMFEQLLRGLYLK